MENKKITAIIPVRKGSQRVKDKNLRPFAGTSLLEVKLNMLLKVPEIDSIIVNTNSEAAIELVEEEYSGTKVSYHRREEYYASSQCSGSEFFRHIAEVTDTDIIIYAPCTSPFVKPKTVSKCIQQFLNHPEYDSLATVSPVKEFLWLDGKALNYDPAHAPNSQNLPDVVAINFGTTVVYRETMIENSNIIGKNPQFIVTDEIEAVDIDTPLDFYIAEQLYKKVVIDKRGILD